MAAWWLSGSASEGYLLHALIIARRKQIQRICTAEVLKIPLSPVLTRQPA